MPGRYRFRSFPFMVPGRWRVITRVSLLYFPQHQGHAGPPITGKARHNSGEKSEFPLADHGKGIARERLPVIAQVFGS